MQQKKTKRIQVSFDEGTKEVLEILCAKENRSLSEMVRKITENWLDRFEDQYWCDLAAQDSGETVSAEEVWKDV